MIKAIVIAICKSSENRKDIILVRQCDVPDAVL